MLPILSSIRFSIISRNYVFIEWLVHRNILKVCKKTRESDGLLINQSSFESIYDKSELPDDAYKVNIV